MIPFAPLIRLFTRHRTAANLLMVAMLTMGIFGLFRLHTQFFPDIGIDVISVSVEWPGASAEDVDANVVQAIEPEVRFLDGVKRVLSSSLEGKATVAIEFDPGTDMQSALADVETAVGEVTTLPVDSETPEVRRLVRYDTISRIVISGPFSEAALKSVAKDVRDALLERGIDKVDLRGARDEEIWVEVWPETLRRLDLTLADIAERIGVSSQDLPSGATRGGSERQIRSLGLLETAEELRGIEIRSLQSGQKIYLGDVAEVREAFKETDTEVRRDRVRAVELHVRRAVNNDALKLADTVNTYVAQVAPTLPAEMRIEQYNVMADLIRGRINLLLRNGAGGLILVLAVLFLFLNSRVAFWVEVGIPVSLMGTLGVMLLSGQSINMISLFGLIMAIGIVVDDAIVVGEHAETRHRAGVPPVEAAESGALHMAVPVTASSLTTIAAFLPLIMITDVIGQVIIAIPFVAVAVILASLVECFLILPGHMRHALRHGGGDVGRFRSFFDTAFNNFREGSFRRSVGFCLRWRYATLATALATLILSAGLVLGGRVAVQFFAGPEPDIIFANVQMVSGTPRERTQDMLGEMVRALKEVEDRVVAESGTPGVEGFIVMTLVTVGAGVGHQFQSRPSGDQVGGLVVELLPVDERPVRTSDFMVAWEEAIHQQPGVERLTIVPAQAGPPGRDMDVRLNGENLFNLKTAAAEVMALLARYPGVSGIEEDLPYGKEEAVLTVTPHGRALGFTTESVGRQVRNAHEGAIAKRFARGDEEVWVRVRYPKAAVRADRLDSLLLRGTTGAEVLLSEVVREDTKTGFARIRREDGNRQVRVTAELDKRITNTAEILSALHRDGLGDIAEHYQLTPYFAGKAEEQERTFGDMRYGAALGLVAIYIILAWTFGSYTRPIVVMGIIPLGFVGATVGHLIMGFDLTILSFVALIGLSGIVVNDSIILVSNIDERLERGDAVHDAITDGACDRLRAVILTSGTTIGGLTPLMFETSLQAQFLIPMAVTIVFGLLAATVLVLLVVPAALGVQDDLAHLFAGSSARPRTAGASGPGA